jgi:hypothetical protein
MLEKMLEAPCQRLYIPKIVPSVAQKLDDEPPLPYNAQPPNIVLEDDQPRFLMAEIA